MDPLDKLAKIVGEIDRGWKTAEPTPPKRRPWSIARVLAHCAQSLEYSITGYPELRSGLFRATIGPLVKRRFLKAGKMSHDVMGSIAGAPEIANEIAFDEARARLHAAIEGFRNHAGPFAPHLAYGRCTKDEYAALHLLHVEDHLRGATVS
jgi:uncharacterized protein DUF1569